MSQIPNFPDYKIYPDGRVYRYYKNRPRRKLKPSLTKDGYIVLAISKNNKKYLIKHHRVLAELFIENPFNLNCVDHYDGNRSNNCLSNLRWVDLSTNSRNSIIPKNNTSGVKGVRVENKSYGIRYRAFWSIGNGKTKSKTFNSLEEAKKYRLKMEKINYNN